jgi:hypothetical protein
MPNPKFKIGQGAIADTWVGEPELVTILDGPVLKDGKTLYKVRHVGFENWYPEERLTPCRADDFDES